MAAAEFNAVVLSANLAGQRVTHIFDVGDAARGIPIFFKGQNREQQIDVVLDAPGAIRTPGPKLRAYIIDDRNAAAMEPSRQTQIEMPLQEGSAQLQLPAGEASIDSEEDTDA